ncbi:SDR family NAD(P)-dependent oxidoreductase [Sphingomonas panacisoli]|uniref:SDR family NAD(P)-dependent oxidoreductase n=1 Tax=Sphingomonas panacisoli TaxID=1813879 RepID=A0A5B8LI28_9SPHN|nr:SDR family oxidoreductase [Sphingomonas panacisoli]QDZ07711.1 SDR family NAD(P)-dependent oxidoreductase [Sphingomonas panacisoli]
MKTNGNTILITGGGSGIGEALAHRFHDAGNTVIIAGRRQEALDAAAAGRSNMHTVTLDVESAEAIEAFAKAVVAAHPTLNVLINNAGIMKFETLETKRDLADAEATIVTNLLGPIRLTDALIDHLIAQADAAIVNVTSGLAFVPRADASTYCATKAAIHSYTVSLRETLTDKVEVIELVPPGVQTDLTPGQVDRSGYMPLAEFADEVMGLFAQEPTPREILVERVKPFRTAEAEGRFDAMVTMLDQVARATRTA